MNATVLKDTSDCTLNWTLFCLNLFSLSDEVLYKNMFIKRKTGH